MKQMKHQQQHFSVQRWVDALALQTVIPRLMPVLDTNFAHISPVRFSDAKKAVARIVSTGKCKDVTPGVDPSGLDDAYVDSAMQQASLVLVANSASNAASTHNEAKKRMTPSAFLCARVFREGDEVSLFVDAACSISSGGGTHLFQIVNAIADAWSASVQLHAVPTALSFYARPDLGFEFRDTCAADAVVVDPLPVRGVRVSDTVSVQRDLGSFLKTLHVSGLSADPRVACNTRDSANHIFDRKCYSSGYVMTRCLGSTTRARSPRRSLRSRSLLSKQNSPSKSNSKRKQLAKSKGKSKGTRGLVRTSK